MTTLRNLGGRDFVFIKKIKLSEKRGGNGYVSSFSVNIGSNEAKECGLVFKDESALLCKYLDEENQQIIIKRKRFTLTNRQLKEIIDAVDELYPPVGERTKVQTLSLSDFDVDSYFEQKKTIPPEEKALKEILEKLSYEMITDLITVMLIGRDRQADMTLKGEARFLDYWEYLSGIGVFNERKRALIDYVMEKVPLAQYLRDGLQLLKAPTKEDDSDEDESDYNIW